ncbi:hypothetical protein [Erwinia sorbitola]|uniref:Dynamin family protein n=1 Tax=Erwinia sorbitola TaxID=2681984 RepID=A0A6I6EH63_9GAMM|nr:hypothetical protein [Erwinia sorbitola]QGU85871.1 hypothetical protein GN242_00925 [Erwinia sorbitola]
MTMDATIPNQIYQNIVREVDSLLTVLASGTRDESLTQATAQAVKILEKFRHELDHDIASLQNNAEWDEFTIAFYGETNAGKSTLIETLRILLNEPTKQKQRQQFTAFRQQHSLAPEQIDALHATVQNCEATLTRFNSALVQLQEDFNQQNAALQQQIQQLTDELAAKRSSASLWQRLIGLLIKSPEKIAILQLKAQQAAATAGHSQSTSALLMQKAAAEQQHSAALQQQSALQEQLTALSQLADGQIIGDGRSDFTLDTQSYHFESEGQRFALLDVPGIEGKEEKVSTQITNAVQKAHAVFYLTSKATAPQKGDAQNSGTLEKIKAHLGAQTEVWAVYNKRITNPMQLTRGSLVSDDESESLRDLDDKMREQLGEHYRQSYTLSAQPAFLALADHLAPGSKLAQDREKFLQKIPAADILLKSRLTDFHHLLTKELVRDSKAKIAHSNLNKAVQSVNTIVRQVKELQQKSFGQLQKDLDAGAESARYQLDNALAGLRARLASCGETAVDEFKSTVRSKIYRTIEDDISNDRFKSELREQLEEGVARLQTSLPEKMQRETKYFQDEIADVIRHHQQQTLELMAATDKFGTERFNINFDLKFKIDSGLKVGGLIGTAIGGALMFWNPAGWLLLAPALASLVFSFAKALWGALNAKFKMSQQRKSADENLNRIAGNLRSSLYSSIDKIFPELENTIKQLQSDVQQPVEQVKHINRMLLNATKKLTTLSDNIETEARGAR